VRHRYECQLRWADMDQLGHVNNVIYVDYLQEARIDMLLTHAPDARAEDLAEGVVVVRHEVSYERPLTFRHEPVLIDSWVSEIRAASFTMAYEVYDETPEGRMVYLRAITVLTPYVFATERPRRITADEKQVLGRFLGENPLPPASKAGEPRVGADGTFDLQVRFSDVDVYGHVNNVKYFEYIQEARIDFMRKVWHREAPGIPRVPVVIAHVDVDYRVPILFRPEPYVVRSWVSHVGRSSLVVETDILEGDTVLARGRTVLVTFDRQTQRAAPAPEAYRQLWLDELARSGG
jgi:acyl-CoA thioester hydrolase